MASYLPGVAHRWFCQVRLELGAEQRSCLIGPLASWTEARRVSRAWEREFGEATTSLRYGRMPARFQFVGSALSIVPASVPLAAGGWLARRVSLGLVSASCSR